jgi:hypothetical protein
VAQIGSKELADRLRKRRDTIKDAFNSLPKCELLPVQEIRKWLPRMFDDVDIEVRRKRLFKDLDAKPKPVRMSNTVRSGRGIRV